MTITKSALHVAARLGGEDQSQKPSVVFESDWATILFWKAVLGRKGPCGAATYESDETLADHNIPMATEGGRSGHRKNST